MVNKSFYKNKTIVITQIRLHDYAGSEIVTLELADHFLSLGMNVIIATHTFGGLIKKEFSNLKNIKIITSNQKNFNKILKETEVDYVWVHHQYIPEVLIGQKGIKYIYHHMSPYVELESPLFWRLEEGLADVILFNSVETRDRYISVGYFNDRQDRLAIFGNPAPIDFYTTDDSSISMTKKPKRILIVSNHLPKELEDARKILEHDGVSMVSFGTVINGKPTRVLPKHISDVDVVITIGKTVQYALAAGVPVYCYDHFGGPGYLSNKNYTISKNLNFSGRGFKRKSAERIAKDIIANYSKAVQFSIHAKEELASEFKLNQVLNKVFETVIKTNELTKKPTVQQLDVSAYVNNMRIIERNVRGITEIQSQSVNQLSGRVAELESNTEGLVVQLQAKEELIQNMQNSIAYKLGLSLIMPLIMTKTAIRKVKNRRDAN